MPDVKMDVEIVLEDDVVNGFSYSFCRALLDKLKELILDRSVFANHTELMKEPEGIEDNVLYEITDSARWTIRHLLKQMLEGELERDDEWTLNELEETAQNIAEFLSAFEVSD